MTDFSIAIIFFVYGLAFFSMGLVILVEAGRSGDLRIRYALRALAIFGIIHGFHEWLEAFELLQLLPEINHVVLSWENLRLGLLTFSFLLLAAFGAVLLLRTSRYKLMSVVVPLLLLFVRATGLVLIGARVGDTSELYTATDVWTRYVLAVPAALLACLGLLQQVRLRNLKDRPRFGRDYLWAAAAFGVYALGQVFTRESVLPPSHIINQGVFLESFGFPVQLLRAGAAVAIALFIIRSLRTFEYETQQEIARLQEQTLREAEHREELRSEFLRRVVDAQEAERQRIARELHDETGQALTAVALGLRSVATTMRKNLDKAAKDLRELEGLVAQSLTELQRVVANLRPTHLDDLGLASALRWFARDIQGRSDIDVDVEIIGDERSLPSEITTSLFRITQEALTNVVKHAEAKLAMVILRYDEDEVILEVLDYGRGFDLEILDSSDRPTWGVLGMKERASLVGGQYTLESRIGQGTQICVTIPYPEEEGVTNEYTSPARG
ncbi:MAG: sensor histidine kinase [Anaerolineales bacterium]